MPSLSAFVACENKSNLVIFSIFSTALIKKRLFRDISCNFLTMVLISNCVIIVRFIVCTLPCTLSAGEIERFSLQRNFQKGEGLIGSQVLEEPPAGKMGVTFFREEGGREDCSFYIRNKLKSKILNVQKSL